MTITPNEWLSELQINFNPGGQFDPQVVQLADGNILIVYSSDNDPVVGPGSDFAADILGRVYDPLGNPVSIEFQINTARTGGAEVRPAVVALDNGGFMVTYESFFPSLNNPTWSIWADVFDASRNHVRSIEIEDSSSVSEWDDPEVASISDTNAFVVYSDGSDIYGEIINPSNGSIISSRFLIANQSSGDFQGVDVTAVNSDIYVITYADRDPGNDELYFHFYNTANSFLSNQILISDNFSDISEPSVAALSFSNFAIAWEVDGSGGSNTGIRVAVYNGFGVNTVSEFNPATTLAGNQTSPEIVALENGEFIVAWVDENLNDIRGQRFELDGTPVGAEFAIVNNNNFEPRTFSMEQMEDGRFVVSFQRTDTSNDTDIFFAIWDPRTEPNTTPVYDDDIVFGTPLSDTVLPTLGSTFEYYMSEGNDTIWVDGALNGISRIFDGGAGTDTLGQLNAGIISFFDSDISNFETFKFNAGASDGIRTALFYNQQIEGFNTIDFAQGGSERVDRLIVELDSSNSIDLSGLTFVDYEADYDEIIIRGDSSSETITGSSIADTIRGNGGVDTINGGGGNDLMIGAVGADEFDGDSGSDTVSYEDSFNGVVANLSTGFGSGGDAAGDTFISIENLTGSENADQLQGNGFSNILIGLDGDDTILAGNETDVLIGGEGADILNGGQGEDLSDYQESDAGVTIFLEGGFGLGGHAEGDTLISIEVLFGSQFADFMYGADGYNYLNGGDGADWLYGRDGDDLLLGAAGADLLFGEQGIDTIYGGDDGDFIYGGTEGDMLFGEDGQDWLRGEEGFDTLHGGENDDVLIGGSGDDIAFGGTGTDTFYGEGDNDTFLGEENGDVAFGQEGNDNLNGGSEGDFLFGGVGQDTINGGTENDLMWGDMPGTGDGVRDIFLFNSNWGFDAIYDFELGIDEIRMSGIAGLTEFSDFTVVDGGADVTLLFGSDAFTLYGVTLTELNANTDDFVF